ARGEPVIDVSKGLAGLVRLGIIRSSFHGNWIEHRFRDDIAGEGRAHDSAGGVANEVERVEDGYRLPAGRHPVGEVALALLQRRETGGSGDWGPVRSALVGGEEEGFILPDWPADSGAVDVAMGLRFRRPGLIGEKAVGIQRGIAVKPIPVSVVLVDAALGDHVDDVVAG